MYIDTGCATPALHYARGDSGELAPYLLIRYVCRLCPQFEHHTCTHVHARPVGEEMMPLNLNLQVRALSSNSHRVWVGASGWETLYTRSCCGRRATGLVERRVESIVDLHLLRGIQVLAASMSMP